MHAPKKTFNSKRLTQSELAVRYRLQALRDSSASPLAIPPVKFARQPKSDVHQPKSHARTPAAEASSSVVEKLSREVRKLEASGRSHVTEKVISTGCTELDQCLPNQGYVAGSIVEYLRTAPACGASYLAYAAAASALKQLGGFLVIVDTQHTVYPPALATHGIDLKQVVLVRPDSRADAIWAVDQALRTPAVAAVIADIEKIDDRAARRLQLAAETGNGLGLLLRSAAARRYPSWAEIQWLVHSVAPSMLTDKQTELNAAGRNLIVQLHRNRGGNAGATVRLQIDSLYGGIQQSPMRERNRHEQAATMHLASELASPKSPSRRSAAG